MNDTNLITIPLNVWQAMLEAKGGMDGSQMLEAWKLALAAVTPVFLAAVYYIQSKSNRTLEKVHTEVNSKASATTAELKELRSLLEASGIRNASLEEQKRGVELATAKAAIPPAPVASAGGFTDAQLAQLKQVFGDTKGPEPITAVLSGPIPMPVTVIKP